MNPEIRVRVPIMYKTEFGVEMLFGYKRNEDGAIEPIVKSWRNKKEKV